MAILPLVSWCLLSQELMKKNPKEIRKKKHGCMELPWGQHEFWGKAECGNLLSGQQGPAVGSSG